MIALALLLVIILLSLSLASGSTWENVLSGQRNDLVFDGRHRNYGAYELRRDYSDRLVFAMFTALGLVGAGIAVPHMIAALSGHAVAAVPKPDTGIDVILEKVYEAPPVTKSGSEPLPPTSGPAKPTLSSVLVVDTVIIEDQGDPPLDTAGTAVGLPGPGPGNPGPGTPGGGGTGTVDNNIYTDAMVQEVPMFPGGLDAFDDYIVDKVRVPYDGWGPGPKEIRIAFVVDKDGSATDIMVLTRGADPDMVKEAIRLFKGMPKWSPGKMNGHAVKCRFIKPISFD